MKHLPSFINYDISASKFLGVEFIDCQSVLDRRKKDVLLLGIVGAWKEFITALKRTLTVVCIIVEDLTFSLIWLVAYIVYKCLNNVLLMQILFLENLSQSSIDLEDMALTYA